MTPFDTGTNSKHVITRLRKKLANCQLNVNEAYLDHDVTINRYDENFVTEF